MNSIDSIKADLSNKNKIAIICVGYNRILALKRLLESLLHAKYPQNDIPLLISIDCSGNLELYDYVRNFNWIHGTKYINIQKERLGLKNHIFQCASLTKYFKGVIILEDDLLISPYFYQYSLACLEKYKDNEKIAGISLYAEETNGFVGLPFQPLQNQYDVFAWQKTCSWGEIWNERMWDAFMSWLSNWNEDFRHIDMPKRIKNWTRAWSKYYYAYMIMNDKYFIYPYRSLSTNCNDAGGEHGGGDASIVQVSLLQGDKNYHFGEFDDLVKYDVYYQNKLIPQWLGIHEDDITIDFYGMKDTYRGHYILSPFKLPYKRIKGFSLSMRPWELNIKYNIKGNDIILYYRDNPNMKESPKRIVPLSAASYHLRGFNMRLLQRYVWNYLMNRFVEKFHANG